MVISGPLCLRSGEKPFNINSIFINILRYKRMDYSFLLMSSSQTVISTCIKPWPKGGSFCIELHSTRNEFALYSELRELGDIIL